MIIKVAKCQDCPFYDNEWGHCAFPDNPAHISNYDQYPPLDCPIRKESIVTIILDEVR